MMDRKDALKKYEEHKSKGLVDEDIIPLLEKINSLECCYTTSSCSGRIAIMQIPEIGDKKNAVFLGKWHREVDLQKILVAVRKYERGYLFLLLQSAILHVVCESFKTSERMIKIALDSGFKYTSIKSVKNGKVLIEILSTENLHIPLGYDGKIIVKEEELEFFVRIANMMLKRIKLKLEKFERKISSLEPSSFCT